MAQVAVTAVAGFALCTVSFAIALSGTDSDSAGWIAAGRALMVGVPIAVGLYAWYRRPTARFGGILVAAGFGWFLTTLSESDNAALYSIGRIAGWFTLLWLVYLILAFPTGHIQRVSDRWLVAAAGLLIVFLYLPTIPLVESYPVPSPFASCEASCPDNAFLLLGSEPAFVDSVVSPVREVLAILLFVAVTVRLAHRVRRSTLLTRRTITPVLTVAVGWALALAVSLAVRRISPDAAVLGPLTWATALALPAMALGFLVGLLRWRVFAGDALQRLGLRLATNHDPEELRGTLAEALDDPTLQVAFWVQLDGGRWIDASGDPLELPPVGSNRSVTRVRDGDRLIAALVHDRALEDQRELIEVAASYALTALENHRLTARLESSLREVGESRARILATADRERRRIERDLHDGVQQRLVALRIKLGLAEDLVKEDPERGSERLHRLGDEVDAALDDIRNLAHGVYPPLLADRGLGEAVRAAARQVPVPVTVESDGIGRYPQEIETAVYFCCLEALQNASKHAPGASAIKVSLSETEALRFEVSDDGSGFDRERVTLGAGLTNMRDRLAAVSGELTISSSPDEGTVVVGRIRLDRAVDA